MTAREAMTPAPLTVTPRTSVGATLRLARLTVERAVEPALTRPAGTPLADAARRLLHHDAPEALVTEDERLVGILTHSDLLRALIPKEPEAAA
jgi:CBS domain-containing protein